MIYELLIELDQVEPKVWRLLRIPASSSMRNLHHAIQLSMGWENCHLYMFRTGDETVTQIDFTDEDDFLEDHEVRIDEFLMSQGDSIKYIYDFGDDWSHTVTLKKIDEDGEDELLPRCLDGARNCPPEDVGGLPGYLNFIKIMANSRLPEYEEMVDWYGGIYDAERFRLEIVNEDFEEFDDYIAETESDWLF